MMFTGQDYNEKPLITIDEKPEVIVGQAEGETPVIIIEQDNEHNDNLPSAKSHRKWSWVLISSIITALLCIIAIGIYWHYKEYTNLGVPVSVTSEQNIEKLQMPGTQCKPEVVMTTDSILGVDLNIYELRGLKAEISFVEPRTTDKDVYLYSRSSDFTSYDPKTNQYIGSLVHNGKEFPSEVSRMGYCAMANDNIVIGVAKDDKVKDYCIEQKGCFFRQFILVSDGMLPARFYLHGKVERRALGRIGDQLYYIESRNKEALWAFADAIREYGFIDAIYITGGTDHCFYRDAQGKCHDIGKSSNKQEKHKGKGIIPWLVFKKK